MEETYIKRFKNFTKFKILIYKMIKLFLFNFKISYIYGYRNTLNNTYSNINNILNKIFMT